MRKRHVWLVSGTFGLSDGRASGYARKLAEALRQNIPGDWLMTHTNGGTYPELARMAELGPRADILLWFADIPNELPKLIPLLRMRMPASALVISKNNRQGKYSLEELRTRMLASGAELMLEFRGADGGAISACLHTGAALRKLPETADIDPLGEAMAMEFLRICELQSPVPFTLVPTRDPDSWMQYASGRETGLPEGDHPGAFGVQRKNHIHEGVDLYVPEGTPVRAMESGVVRWRGAFTGPGAGSPWWNNTESVLIAGESGALNYGELLLAPEVQPGAFLTKGTLLGHALPVLKKDKGRPRTMLHLERYALETHTPIKEWALGTPRPPQLLDPTPLLRAAGGAR